MYYPLHCFSTFISIWRYRTCHQSFEVTAETDSFHDNYGFLSQNSFFLGLEAVVCICLSSTETIFVNEILVDLISIVFSTGSTTECSCTYILVLAAPVRDFTMEGRPHSVLRSLWLCSFPEGSMCLYNALTPTTLGFIGFGYFCIAAVVTVSHGWSKTCSEVQIFMVPAARVVSGRR